MTTHPGAPRVTREGALLRVRLSRPDHHNRLDPADLPVLQAAFDAAAAGDARVLLLESEGPSFCSGYTLQAVADTLDARFERMLDALEHLPIPTVCAIQGGVYGGGTDLALCCDLRIGTHDARMFMPAVRIGLHYHPGGLRRYVQRLGLAQAQRLLLTGATLDSPEMLRIGFLSECVAPADLQAAVARCVDALLAGEPRAQALTKRSLAELAAGTADESVLRARYEETLRAPALRERLGNRAR